MRKTLIFLATILAASAFAADGTWSQPARGMSMFPVIQPGDSVRVANVPFAQLRAYIERHPGTIVLFRNHFASNKQYPITCHTALYFNRWGVLVCKGVNNPTRDICGVTARNYMGVVTHIRRGATGSVIAVGPGGGAGHIAAK